MKICFGTTLKHLIIPIQLGVFSLLLLSFLLFGGVAKAVDTQFYANVPSNNGYSWNQGNGGLSYGNEKIFHKFNTGIGITNLTKVCFHSLTDTNEVVAIIYNIDTCEIIAESLPSDFTNNSLTDDCVFFEGGGVELNENSDYGITASSNNDLRVRSALGYSSDITYYISSCQIKTQYEGLYTILYNDPEWTPLPSVSISYTGDSVVEQNIYDNWQIPFSYDISSEIYQSCSEIYVSLNSDNQMFDFVSPKVYLKGRYDLYPLVYNSFLTGSVNSWYLQGGLGFSSLPLSLNDVSVDLTCVDYEGVKTSYSSSETFDLTLVNDTFSFPDDYIESGVITGSLNVDYNSNLEGSLFVPLNYSLINHDYNSPYSDVCLKDVVTGMVDETTCKTLSSASGVIFLDTPDYACMPSRRFSFVYREDNPSIPNTPMVVLETEPFIINYLNYPYCVPDFDNQDDFGIFGNWIYNSVGSFFIQVSKTFPFSLITLIDKSWRDSAYLELEGSLSFLDITDESGDISIDIPLISTTSSSTNLVIFGSSIFESNSNMVSFFNNFRSFSTYLFYFLFFMALYRLAFRIYNILKVQ